TEKQYAKMPEHEDLEKLVSSGVMLKYRSCSACEQLGADFDLQSTETWQYLPGGGKHLKNVLSSNGRQWMG
ncbi:unnamed protein product, partial [Ceratitis capitata]